ncbi:MAG: hypothetical protein ACHQIO_08695, partial [Nevskiales bacterium]
YMQNKDWDNAVQAFTAAWHQTRRLHGDTHQHSIAEAFNLALAYQHAGQLTQAIDLLRATDANAGKAFGADAPLPQLIEYVLADSLVRAGRGGEAQPLAAHLKAEQLNASEPDNDWSTRLPLLHAELAYAATKSPDNQQQLDHAIQAMSASKDDEHEDLAAEAQRQLSGAPRRAQKGNAVTVARVP